MILQLQQMFLVPSPSTGDLQGMEIEKSSLNGPQIKPPHYEEFHCNTSLL